MLQYRLLNSEEYLWLNEGSQIEFMSVLKSAVYGINVGCVYLCIINIRDYL